jgi:glycosyltransferase involved in cell wall biosynthesis
VISFVWSPNERLPAGTGGSENYTVGQVRELNRRGIDAQVVTIGLGLADGREEFFDIPFHSVPRLVDVGDLDDTVVFVSEAPHVMTRRPAYQILHVPPPLRAPQRAEVAEATRDRVLIATSRFAAQLWAGFLDVDVATVHVVHPFAEPVFGLEPRPAAMAAQRRVLYAGRLSPEKGIYTFLSMLHTDLIDDDPSLFFTVTTAGAERPQGHIIESMLRTHPRVDLVAARTTSAGMATLMAEHDVVVMPSNGQYWHETFGIVSIEAQHTGARVVASDDGGLPETQCGSLHLVEADNADALAVGIIDAFSRDRVTSAERDLAARCFTVSQSVDALLCVLRAPQLITPFRMIQELEELINLPATEPPSTHLSQDSPDVVV